MATRIRQWGWLAAVLSVLMLATSLPAAAETRFGVRGGVNTETDGPFVGAEVVTSMSPSWWFNPNFEFASGDRVDITSLNADVHYDFPVSSPALFWMGFGPAVLIRDFERPRRDNETDAAVNLFTGVGWRTRGGPIPYMQVKAVMSDESFAAFGMGVRF